jgi:glycosyltransferase involved in cell wall biosynthesis
VELKGQIDGHIKKGLNLLVINYVMDNSHSLLSHQARSVDALAAKFSSVIVLTGKIGDYSPPNNVKVFSSNWIPGQNIRNVFNFVRLFMEKIRTEKIDCIFSHMTAVQSALIGPIAKLHRIRHILWYAHKKNNIFLRWDALWVDKILTSTFGSCPLRTEKVCAIGQAVSPEDFNYSKRNFASRNHLIHVGRFDIAKNVDFLIRSVEQLNSQGFNFTFEQIGSASNSVNLKYEKKTRNYVRQNKLDWVSFYPNKPRTEVPKMLKNSDAFLHAYNGSLDKTLIEATMFGLPVITTNQEYISEFGNWSENSKVDIEEELKIYVNLGNRELELEIERRRNVAIANHSLSKWVEKVYIICHGW